MIWLILASKRIIIRFNKKEVGKENDLLGPIYNNIVMTDREFNLDDSA